MKERSREALSQDLGTISSNVLGISRAGGNSIWASLTGMSSGLSRCRNIGRGRGKEGEEAYAASAVSSHLEEKKKKNQLIRSRSVKTGRGTRVVGVGCENTLIHQFCFFFRFCWEYSLNFQEIKAKLDAIFFKKT